MDITADSFAFPKVAHGKTIVRSRRTNYAFAGMISALGLAPGQQLLLQQPLSAPSVVTKVACADSTDCAPPVAGDLIASIKEGLRLNMTEIAEVLGVTRPTVYNWIKGKNPPDTKTLHRLQTLSATADFWKQVASGGDQDILMAYTGPQANEESIRQALSGATADTDGLRTLIETRHAQYREAREKTRTMLGDPLPLPAKGPAEETRRLNELWAKNAKALHATRSRDH